MASTSETAVVRPTEAQLRWAQFHHKRRAVGVRERILELYAHPTTVDQVSGALPEDGASNSSCSECLVEIRRGRPKTSRGRRALLSVSRRNYETRREVILQHGYHGLEHIVSSGSAAALEDEEHDEVLDDIFRVQPLRRRRKRQDDESFRRFQAACHAMMMNLAAPPKHSIVIPTRRWTRNVDQVANLDDIYLDPKWGIRRQQFASSENAEQHLDLAPLDRGASWMTFLPKATSTARDNPYYHDPSEAIPPSPRSHAGSDSQHSESSTLALQQPGAQKFNKLVALVQQRMIQRHNEELRIAREVEGTPPKMKVLPGSNATRLDGATMEGPSDELPPGVYRRTDNPSPFPPNKYSRSRKTHYVPRMRLRDFLPEGTTAEEVEELERSVMEGRGIPPKMKLKGFPVESPSKRRKSRAQEIAESFEPQPERRMSKARQMAKLLEGPDHPTMRLRQSLEGYEEEKKSPDSRKEALPPRKISSGRSPSFNSNGATTSDRSQGGGDSLESDDLTLRHSTKVPQTPPRRKAHPMSEKYLQATEGSQYPASQQNITIKPLPPGTCCARCDRPSHVASKEASNPAKGDQSGEPFSQIRQLKSKVSVGSARVSDFFSQLRQDGSFDGGKTWKSEGKRESTRKERASDFFATMRQLNPDDEEAQNDTPVEETDFFAQVREMIATEDDSDEAAIQRTSDFFEQIRQMSHEGEEEDGCAICEDCQVQDHVHENLANNVHVQLSQSTAGSFLGDRKGAVSDDDGQSPRSGISGLLSRGRKSIATGINAISEKGSQVASNPGQAHEILGNVMPGRVGDFLQRLQGRNEKGASKVDVATTQNLAEKINVQSIPEGSLLEGNEFQSMDREMLPYDGLNDIEAMAVYRKSQELKRQFSPVDDDASSHSSFHILPTDIREVVKSRGSSPAKPARAVSTSPTQAGLDTANPGTRIEASGQKVEPTAPVVFSSSSPVSPTPDVLPSTKYRETHENIIRNSPLLVGALDQGIIDTDGTTSDASYSGMDPSALASLMMSPDLLQKRLHQAVRAAESRRWDQLQYLLNANPWLAEMSELTTDQFLLHKIAFFGKSAPAALCEHILNMFPSAVYKFDQDGNVPLHLAAAAGHLKMIRLLGDRFEGGASIRNEDGMLPLHFTIASYGDYSGIYGEEEDYDENDSSPLTVIKTVLKFFPKAVAIGDNDGNLPIHVAAECLLGDFGVDVVYILLDAADHQLQTPDGARFYNKVKLEDKVNEDISAGTVKTDSETISAIDDEDIHCSMVKNEFGETPLLAAVRSRRGWDVIEALVSGPGGHVAALYEDAEGNTALHLLVGEYEDPAAAMSILKIAPMAASVRNSGGMLPIEIACLRSMPPEVVLAIGLVDLPFDIDEKDVVITREDCGGSWWFLACECDDHYADIVQQIIMICTFQQARQLSFWKGGPRKQKQTVLSRATPKCKQVLQHALRFLGRFEIIGDGPLHCDEVSGVTVFDALDFMDSVNEGGRRVTLKCYSTEDSFSNTIALLHDLALDPAYVEEIEIVRGESIPRQFCLVIESPQATLNRVVDGMMKKPGYQNDTILRKKYAAKICAVLRFVAKSVRQLHRSGAVHGSLCLENCGKFQHSSWKLLDSTGIVKLGDSIEPTRFGKSFPPESLHLAEEAGAVFDSDNPAVKFLAMPADISTDIWAFGKLAYEALVGRPLVEFDKTKLPSEDTISMLEILEWDQASMKRIFTDLLDSGVTDTCAELVTSCLFPNPEDRPKSMDIILEDPFWKDMRQFRERSSPSKRSTTSSGFTEATSKSLLTENASVNTSIETDRAEI